MEIALCSLEIGDLIDDYCNNDMIALLAANGDTTLGESRGT